MPYKLLADKRRNDKEYAEKRKEQAGGLAPFPHPMKTLNVKGGKDGLKIAVIPDCQVKPGVNTDHLAWCGEYLAIKKPDIIVQIGDFGDFPSLSTHDMPGSQRMEGLRYKKDVEAIQRGMDRLLTPLLKVSSYHPRRVLTLGNHEDRITRAVARDPKLEGLMSLDDLGYVDAGWDVYPFLQPVVIGGVAFCHYFPSGVMGRPITSAKAILTKLHMSAYAGHQQGRDIAYAKRADGKDMTAIISGSFYQHDEDYMNPFTNNHWRGMYMLHEVKDGSFDEMAVSMAFLKRRFGNGKKG
jgi:hypothetical protein